jgi:cell division protein FtsX
MALLSQVFSSVSVGFLLILIGLLFWMQQGLRTVLVRLQGEQVMTVYIDKSIPVQDENRIVEEIRSLGNFPSSVEIKRVTSQQFISSLKTQYPDLVRQLEDLGSETEQVVPRYISISGMIPQAAVEKIKKVSGVETVESSKDRYHHIIGAFKTLRWVTRILMGGIFFALLTGLIHLSRMNSHLHRDALELLRFWGAGTVTLFSPGMVSGFLVGLLGGAIACGGWFSVGVSLARYIRSLSSMLKGMPPVSSSHALLLLAAGGGIGLFAGLFGSLPSQEKQRGEGGLGV